MEPLRNFATRRVPARQTPLPSRRAGWGRCAKARTTMTLPAPRFILSIESECLTAVPGSPETLGGRSEVPPGPGADGAHAAGHDRAVHRLRQSVLRRGAHRDRPQRTRYALPGGVRVRADADAGDAGGGDAPRRGPGFRAGQQQPFRAADQRLSDLGQPRELPGGEAPHGVRRGHPAVPGDPPVRRLRRRATSQRRLPGQRPLDLHGVAQRGQHDRRRGRSTARPATSTTWARRQNASATT